MAVFTATGKLTLADYLAMPETMQRQEIVDGELIIMPGTPPRHQHSALLIARLLQDQLKPAAIGDVLIAPVDVLIREEPFTYRQPDVFVVARDELERHPDYATAVPTRARPCLVVEILSPSNYPKQMAERLADYAFIRVDEVWLVSLDNRSVEVLRLQGDRYETNGVYRGEETIRSVALPHLALTAGALFP